MIEKLLLVQSNPVELWLLGPMLHLQNLFYEVSNAGGVLVPYSIHILGLFSNSSWKFISQFRVNF